jgi:hypothetical protein
MDPSQLPPNYDESRKPTVIGVSVFLMCVSTAMVGLRVWTRTVLIKQMGIDDWMAVATLVGFQPTEHLHRAGASCI